MLNSKVVAVCLLTSAFGLTGCGGAATSEDVSSERQLSQTTEEVAQEEMTQEEVAQEETMQEEVAQEETMQEEVAQEETMQEEVAQEETMQEEEVTVEEEVSQEEITESINEMIEEVIANVQVRLGWTPASFYEDGSVMPETEISHYELVYGTNPESMDTSVNIDLAGLSSYDIENLLKVTGILLFAL